MCLDCVRTKATLMEEVTKCDIHKGERIGFVLSQFTDGANMKNNVILHTIASFTYISGDQEGKARNAGTATTSTINNNVYGSWKVYTKEREAAKKPTPELIEIETRRRYFDDEYEMMKVYSARQVIIIIMLNVWFTYYYDSNNTSMLLDNNSISNATMAWNNNQNNLTQHNG